MVLATGGGGISWYPKFILAMCVSRDVIYILTTGPSTVAKSHKELNVLGWECWYFDEIHINNIKTNWFKGFYTYSSISHSVYILGILCWNSAIPIWRLYWEHLILIIVSWFQLPNSETFDVKGGSLRWLRYLIGYRRSSRWYGHFQVTERSEVACGFED